MEFTSVEIRSVPGPLEIRSGPPRLLGSCIDANGKRGYVRAGETRRNGEGSVVVETLDGLCFEVPAGCTQQVEHVGPKDGGFDFLWPESVHQEQELGYAVSARLRERGFCVVHVPEADSVRQDFAGEVRLDEESFQLPEAEMEEAFLGTGSASKVSWIVGGFGTHKARSEATAWSEIFAGGGRHVAAVARELAALPGGLDFEPWSRGGAVLVRVPLAAGERGELDVTSLRLQDPDAVGEHLDFLQRRKLCMMHVLESCGGSVELHHLSTGMKVRIPVARGRLLIFQHDVMSYAYTPKDRATSADDIVLQAWMLEEPPLMRLDRLHNSDERMDELAEIAGGCPLPRLESRKVNIMSIVGRYPGDGKSIEGAQRAWMSQTDGLILHPRARWDWELYYTPDSGQFGNSGKSGSRHAGFLNMEDFTTFDNKFFGISDTQAAMTPPQTRLLFECSYEAFHAAGHTLQTLKGANIGMNTADIGQEWDHWAGYISSDLSPIPQDQELWAKTNFMHGNISGMQVAHNFGLTGPLKLVDTACSASLVAANINWASLRQFQFDPDRFKEALTIGTAGILSPFPFIGLSTAGMLGRLGRSLTFNMSANGFNRGEGCGGLLHKVSDDPKDNDLKLGNQLSGYVNQDGRSASLTAPNGPSQQAVMRGSMNLENLLPTEISIQENHGTGTALGDPIEVGSVRAVFRKRNDAIFVTTGKSHSGHLEGTAGSLSLCKTFLALLYMCESPNVHLRELNSHIDMAGWPGDFPTEMVDLAAPHRIAGLNGFGFGGTNSHAELWAKCMKGYCAPAQRILMDRKSKGQAYELLGGRATVLEIADCVTETCPRCWGPMCYRCGAADPMGVGGGGGGGGEGKHTCTAIRKEFSSYEYCSDCYEGEYQYGSMTRSARGRADDQTIFIIGSWDNWGGLSELRRLPDGTYVGEVRLGDCGFEHFQLVVGEVEQQTIVPVVSNATPDARIVGPVQAGQPQCWMIDGRADGASPGTIYEVRFRWQERSKSVSWKKLGRRIRHSSYDPTWAIVGSFNGWKPQDMHRSIAQPGTWEFIGQLGTDGVDKLHFMRSGDPTQRLYPLRQVADDNTVPIMGPGLGDGDKGWEVAGTPHSFFQARLWAKDGAVFVELKVETRPAVVFRTRASTSRDTYQLVGSFCDWRLAHAKEFTSPDPSRPGLFVSTFFIGEAYREEFQIVVNQNVSQIYHPVVPSEAGRSFVAGPSPSETALHWEVFGLPGQMVEVTFDHAAEDNLKLVTCRVGALMLQ